VDKNDAIWVSPEFDKAGAVKLARAPLYPVFAYPEDRFGWQPAAQCKDQSKSRRCTRIPLVTKNLMKCCACKAAAQALINMLCPKRK
jgi:hypothetical protein